METKKIKQTLVAAHTFTTSLSKINEAVGVKPNQVMEELAKQGIQATAPQIWNYIGCDGQMDTDFTLQICMPVSQKGQDTAFVNFIELNDYSCIVHTHNGPWSEFAAVYEKLFADMVKEGHQPTGNCREIYHHCDFEDQTKCVTEIQVEI